MPSSLWKAQRSARYILVFAEEEGNDEPNSFWRRTASRALDSPKCTTLPTRNIGSVPGDAAVSRESRR